jgi:hypothetical protein
MRERILEPGLITGLSFFHGNLIPCWIFRTENHEWSAFTLNQLALQVAAKGSKDNLINLIDEITVLKITDSDLECFFEMDEEVLVSSDAAFDAEE